MGLRWWAKAVRCTSRKAALEQWRVAAAGGLVVAGLCEVRTCCGAGQVDVVAHYVVSRTKGIPWCHGLWVQF